MSRGLKALGWTVAGLCALLLGSYGVLLLINARDEAPSAQALRLEQVYRQRPAVADADNGFVYLLGMGAPAGEDPWTLGRARQAALTAMDAASHAQLSARQAAMPAATLRTATVTSPAVRALSSACDDDYLQCAHALNDDAALVATQWLADDAELLARYRTLIALPAWRETVPADVSQLPSYQNPMQGQRLLLMQTWLAARHGDAASVTQWLQQDLRFWRTVLRDSDTLIGKSIATAALTRHFALGNLALRELGSGQAAALPPEWRVPLGEDERDFTRPLAGELRLVQASLRLAALESAQAPDATLSDRLQRPFFKPQATINLVAAADAELAQASVAPYDVLPVALDRTAAAADFRWWQWLFNPTGRVVMTLGNASYSGYVLRVADLEGARRAAVEAATLRARGVPANAVAQALLAPGARLDPYTGGPLRWDADAGAIRFSSHDPRPGRPLFVY